MVFSVFHTSSVKAEDYNWGGSYAQNNTNTNTNNVYNTPKEPQKGGGNTSSANLPINNGLVFLMIAGLVIGIYAVNKNKSFKFAVEA